MSLQTYVFVDHSNIEYSAQKASGESQGFRSRPEKPGKKIVRLNDTRCTVQPKEVWNFLESLQGQSIAKMHCYTSDSSLTEHGRQGRRDIRTRNFPKQNGREKSVDSYLVADAVELIVKEAPGVISLWTGDADIITPVVEKAKNYSWRVDLWAFKGSRSNVIKANPEVISHTKELEECFQHFTETKYKSERMPKPEDSFQLRFEKDEWDAYAVNWATEDWDKIVEEFSGWVQLPLQGWKGQQLLYLFLAVPREDLDYFMKGIAEQKEFLERKIRSWIEIKMQVKISNCRLVIQSSGGANVQGQSSGSASGNWREATSGHRGNASGPRGQSLRGVAPRGNAPRQSQSQSPRGSHF